MRVRFLQRLAEFKAWEDGLGSEGFETFVAEAAERDEVERRICEGAGGSGEELERDDVVDFFRF